MEEKVLNPIAETALPVVLLQIGIGLLTLPILDRPIIGLWSPALA